MSLSRSFQKYDIETLHGEPWWQQKKKLKKKPQKSCLLRLPKFSCLLKTCHRQKRLSRMTTWPQIGKRGRKCGHDMKSPQEFLNTGLSLHTLVSYWRRRKESLWCLWMGRGCKWEDEDETEMEHVLSLTNTVSREHRWSMNATGLIIASKSLARVLQPTSQS